MIWSDKNQTLNFKNSSKIFESPSGVVKGNLAPKYFILNFLSNFSTFYLARVGIWKYTKWESNLQPSRLQSKYKNRGFFFPKFILKSNVIVYITLHPLLSFYRKIHNILNSYMKLKRNKIDKSHSLVAIGRNWTYSGSAGINQSQNASKPLCIF